MARRQAGLNPERMRHIREDWEKIAEVPGQSGSSRKKVHAGTYVHDEAYNILQHDCGPWIETPVSTRVSRFRYDYQNDAIQCQWRNNKNPGYIYLGVPYEIYRSMARIASKGRFINSTLNLYDYRPITPEELDAPSNDKRKAVSRTRT